MKEPQEHVTPRQVYVAHNHYRLPVSLQKYSLKAVALQGQIDKATENWRECIHETLAPMTEDDYLLIGMGDSVIISYAIAHLLLRAENPLLQLRFVYYDPLAGDLLVEEVGDL